MIKRPLLLALVSLATLGITAPSSPAKPSSDQPKAHAAQEQALPRWQQTVVRRVRSKARRQSLRIANEGGLPDYIDAVVTAHTATDIHVHGIIVWTNPADGSVWVDSKQCTASLFGGGDFPRARVIHCNPEGERNWRRERFG
jgi:hypothetical protein